MGHEPWPVLAQISDEVLPWALHAHGIQLPGKHVIASSMAKSSAIVQCWNNGMVAQHILPMPMPGQTNDRVLGRRMNPGHWEWQRGRTFDLGLEVGRGP